MTWWTVLRHNGWQFLIWIDQGLGGLVSTLFKERAFADLTLSANAYRWERDGIRRWPRKFIDLLFWWEADHCRESYESERLRLQMPPELR